MYGYSCRQVCVCVVFVLPGKGKNPRNFANSTSLPSSGGCSSPVSNGAAQPHGEYLCEKESSPYLLPALGRDPLQSNKIEVPTVAFQPLTVALWSINTRDGSHHVAVPLGKGGGGA